MYKVFTAKALRREEISLKLNSFLSTCSGKNFKEYTVNLRVLAPWRPIIKQVNYLFLYHEKTTFFSFLRADGSDRL